MTDILRNGINIAQRVRDMQISGTLSMIIFGVVLIFGIVNLYPGIPFAAVLDDDLSFPYGSCNWLVRSSRSRNYKQNLLYDRHAGSRSSACHYCICYF